MEQRRKSKLEESPSQLTILKQGTLYMKTKLNTKAKRIRKHRQILGKSIAKHPIEIENRGEFGHWEIDTVGGNKYESI